MKISCLLLLALALVAGCTAPDLRATHEAEPVALDGPVTLREGGRVGLGASGDTLRFVNVVNDSRCPVDVTCVWQGEATVRLRLTTKDHSSSEIILTGYVGAEVEPDSLSTPITGQAGAYRIALLALAPYPDTRAVSPDSTSATFRVEAAD